MPETAPKHPFVLFQRSGSAKWWVRFSIKGEGQIRKPLGTTDRGHAEQLALEAWAEARHRNKQGLRSQAKTFRAVGTEFITLLQAEAERAERRQFQVDQYRRKIERYFIGFFGDQPMDAMREADVVRFWEWRRSYWIDGPGKDIKLLTYMRAGRQIRKPIGASVRKAPSLGTLREEGVILRMLLRQAAKWGYIQEANVPDVEVRKVPDNPRPSFSAAEFVRLQRLSEKRIYDGGLNDHVRRDRTILYCYIQIAAFSGMRPTEIKNLNWGDVLGFREVRELPIGDQDIRIRCRGKGKSRTFAAMEAALPAFQLLWMLWEKAHNAPPEDADPVLATVGGKRMQPLKKGLGELLRAAELLTDHRGARRTSYSFRHFYISQQLIAGVDVFALAKNTGTSSAMIERFYADVKLEQIVKQLRPLWNAT